MKHNIRTLKKHKKEKRQEYLHMLTCYDYQTARMLNQSDLDLILVGDSLGNVVLGYDNTIAVTIQEMITFCSAVKRGAPDKFVIGDLPFGSYATIDSGIKNTIELFQKSNVEAIKLEGAFDVHIELVKALTQTGIPVMGHIGLTPQSVHQLGGYYTHGKRPTKAALLLEQAKKLEEAGAFSIVLECVDPRTTKAITGALDIPTIGIGSGGHVDGKVLVLNDLLGMSDEKAPSFVNPVANLFQEKSQHIKNYFEANKFKPHEKSRSDVTQ